MKCLGQFNNYFLKDSMYISLIDLFGQKVPLSLTKFKCQTYDTLFIHLKTWKVVITLK